MNVHTLRLAARGLLLALTLTSPLGASPVTGEDAKAFLWTGVRGNIGRTPRIDVEVTSYGKGGPDEERRVRPDEHVNALRAELAELRLAEATEGPSPAREAARLELWIRACDEFPFEGQGELLIELALERAERLSLRGAGEAALETTHELLLPERLVEAAGEFGLAPADAAWLARAAAWLADPRLTELRGKLTPPELPKADSSDVEAVIEGHLAEGNVKAVLQFGARAVPITERYILAHPSEYPAMDSMDAITMLFKLDEERGARFAIEHLDGAGEVFPLRVLRSMRAANVLKDDGTWNFVSERRGGRSYQRAELIQLVWRDLLERIVLREELVADAFQEVGFLVQMNALSPGLADALERAIRGEDPTLRNKAMAALKEAGWRDTARDLMVRLLNHPSPQVRSYMADRLITFAECRELWPLAGDPSPDVRRAVASGLRPDRVRVLDVINTEQQRSLQTGDDTLRGLDRGGFRVLEALLSDQEPTIYLEAIDILVRIFDDFPALEPSVDTLRSLTGHPDARMRRLLPLGLVDGLPDPLVLEALAQDGDLEVRAAVDHALRNAGIVGPYPQPDKPLQQGWQVLLGASTPWSDAYLPALTLRLAICDSIPESLGYTPFTACHTPAGARALSTLARDTDSQALREGLMQGLSGTANWAGELRGWHLVEPELAQQVLARAWSTDPDPRTWATVRDALATGTKTFQAPGLRWSTNRELPWPLRLLGLHLAAPLAQDAWCEALLEVVSASGQLSEFERGWDDALTDLGRAVRHTPIAGLLAAQLTDSQAVPEEPLVALLVGMLNEASVEPATALRILERWGGRGGWFRTLSMLVVDHVQVDEDEPHTEVFERLLRSDSHVAQRTSDALGRMHLRGHLPLLERALLGDIVGTGDLRSRLQVSAAGALACYLDDQAAEILLRGVGATSDAGVREACFNALDTIRRYQDERARWNTRAGSEQARAEAIAELIGLIETGEGVQRVEAVRALGTLEAVEELPRLVRLTGSKDAALAKAAKETLDAIRRAQERKQD